MSEEGTPRDVLAEDHRNALSLAQSVGAAKLKKVLEAAAGDLERRIMEAVNLRGLDDSTFTLTQMRATLAQVRAATALAQKGLAKVVVDTGTDAAEASAGNTLAYLHRADEEFRGIAPPLQLEEAGIVDQAQSGVRASLLRRLASSGEEDIEGADEEESPAKPGILERYGTDTIGHFEDVLQKGFITRKPWGEVRDEIVQQSPFLQGKPEHWAERIVRTESMAAYNRAGYETVKAADDELGDMVKILSAFFDDRTAADSYAVHGQIRRPQEAFQSWWGLYQHPPNRPNDREIVVPHRISWPIPPYLTWKTDAQIAARWRREGRRVAVPPRPLMTTVPLAKFGGGKEQPKPAAPVAPVVEVPRGFREGVHARTILQVKPRRGEVDIKHVFDEAVPHQGVLDHLASNPIDSLIGKPELKSNGARPNGTCMTFRRRFADGTVSPTRLSTIHLRTKRTNDEKVAEFDPHKSWSISSAEKTPEAAVAATMAHEIGHHIHLTGGAEVNAIVQSAFQQAKAGQTHLTRYGMADQDEYFAESFAAHMRRPRTLEMHDPVGHKLVRDVFDKLGIGKR